MVSRIKRIMTKRNTIIVGITLALWAFLVALTYTSLNIELAELLSLQRLGVYPIPKPLPSGGDGIRMIEGLPYVSEPSVLVHYMLIILAIAVVASFKIPFGKN